MTELDRENTGPDANGELQRPENRFEQPEVISVRHGSFGVMDDGDTTGFGGLVETFELPGASSRPYGGWFDEAVDVLEELIKEAGFEVTEVIEKVVVNQGDELIIHVNRDFLRFVALNLRNDQDLRFEMCLGVSTVNYPESKGREFHALYPFRSFTHNRSIFLEVSVPEDDARIPSIVDIYPGNDWHEREGWDLMGIVFEGHPALTRIEMPQDWYGHPQRKDYPLGGIPIEYRGATIPPVDTRRSYN
ncbi:NADH-quinone oxidoreductase subunit C [Actinomyces minihominis]|uniref:NADH-quinone oxidoreductase subunit C n=1 Tax=Actinomyces minihominis TaxID=2002838 RepID=UPI000C08A229|nr:NADH-quinone oxidoreductase subunit C [Actinomyces minihominis]